MKLIEARVKKFRNIIDSTPVSISNDITCLVGKNESGKTAFLHSLYRLNPIRQNASFKIEDQYPAWLEKRDRLRGLDLSSEVPIQVKFQIEESEVAVIESIFGEGVLEKNELIFSRKYDNDFIYQISINEKNCIKNLLRDLSFSRETRAEITKYQTIKEVESCISSITPTPETQEKDKEAIAELKRRIKSVITDADDLETAIYSKLSEFIPQFIYFDKYSSLPYSVKIRDVLKTPEQNLSDEQLTARSLLRMAAADDAYLLNPDYERRKRELENVANALSHDVLKYWSQNSELRVNPDITQKTESYPNGQTTVIDELKIRIWDNKHQLSLPFTEHSSGFQWFFSFLAAFSEYEYSGKNIIILLDEPGLGLHGKAQADFIRFIEERLSPKRQVIYTTHSPFMVQPNKLERVRIVEEKDSEQGSKITEDVLTTDPDTLFPLQGALGYDLAQHLFISKDNLVVEGISDFTYLQSFSDYFKEIGRQSLNDKWTIVPVGGADLIPTFIALLGMHLDITVLIDSRKEGNQKINNLAEKGYLNNKSIITIGEIIKSRFADIEDLFSLEDYIHLYNLTFRKNHKPEDLTGTDPIVNKIARLENIERFDHGKPADYFLRNKDSIFNELSATTFDNFESLFDKINKTIKK
ncbi:MAG TPA: AAA family ATPase [Tenuifilaceae bacterium]|nr:AAA family ATPase [Tenuifilaceae bacterium]